MKIDILSLFPDMFEPLNHSIINRAREKGIINISTVNIRDFTLNKHKKVDDYPYGGGAGLVMTPEPIFRALESIASCADKKPLVILTSPGGKVFNQELAKKLSKESHLIFICGHYEGIDERVKSLIDMEVSIGDFVLTGGELAAMVMIDSTCRMIPGVLSSTESFEEESFYSGLLEYPQYTRPEVFRGLKVPEVLLSGHHENVRKWRRFHSLKKTLKIRPELIKRENLSYEDKKFLMMIESGKENI